MFSSEEMSPVMRNRTSVVPSLLLTLPVAVLLIFTGCSKEKPEPETAADRAKAIQSMATPSAGAWADSTRTPEALPRMIDLGRGKCIPCKKMEPILKELKQAYAGRAVIEIVNLDEEPHAADMFDIMLIPTQIFFDSTGTEVWRHEGFLPRDEIIARFDQMGVAPAGTANPATGTSGAGTPGKGTSGD
jgi:thioredoxin 1